MSVNAYAAIGMTESFKAGCLLLDRLTRDVMPCSLVGSGYCSLLYGMRERYV